MIGGGHGGRLGHFRDRQRFAAQQRLIDLQVSGLVHGRIGSNPVALLQHDQIAAYHIAAGYTHPLAVANNQRTRRRKIAQRLKDMFGARFLNDGYGNRECRKSQQNQRFRPIAQEQIGDAASQQQRQHRLSHHVASNPQYRPLTCPGQLIGTVFGKNSSRLG